MEEPASWSDLRTSGSFEELRIVVRTVYPAARSWRMRWEATKPEPPVTRMGVREGRWAPCEAIRWLDGNVNECRIVFMR